MKYEEKFIVINHKRFKELDDVAPSRDRMGEAMFSRRHRANQMLEEALENWRAAYENDTGKKLNQKYYVVNQDEPYADKVWELIKKGEESK